ncbi:MAG: VTT domain-containing protein [Oscillospiraceae bacterium]|nr:VTT domain-containing protein [Oscillospiraceae bacterium]
MNILVTLDKNYIPQLKVMLTSLLCGNPDEDFAVYTAHSSLTEDDFDDIRAAVSSRCRVIPIAISDTLFSSDPVLSRIPKETYYRLLAIDFLPEDVERILYLDADTVVINPIKPHYDIDFGDNLIAASGHVSGFVDAFNRRRLKMPKGTRYINAGVMMMNIKGLRDYPVTTEDIFSYIKANAKKLMLADQDVINALYGDKIILIDPRLFNLDEKIYISNSTQIDLDWVRANTAIVHYNGSQKPWKPNYNGQLACFYEKYSQGLNLPPTESKTGTAKRTAVIIAMVAIVAVCAAVYLLAGKQMVEFLTDPVQVKSWLDGQGVWANIIFVAVRAFQTVVKIIPAEPLEIGAGYAFGTFGGLLYCMIGTMIGSFVIILMAKIFGPKLLGIFIPAKKLNSLAFLRNRKKLEVTLFVMYLIPGTPKDLFTYMAPFLPMKISRFIIITGIARIPSIVMSTWIGSELTRQNYITAAAIFIASLVISGVYIVVSRNAAAIET